jgi:hypothetical protein
MKSIIFSVFVLSLISSCNLIPESTAINDNTNDSLNQRIEKQDNNTGEQLISIPKVVVLESKSKICTIRLYKPVDVNLELKNQRPEFNDENFLCVPAAYTTPGNQIDGLFIVQGREVNPLENSKLTGACILSDSGIRMIDHKELTTGLLNDVKQSKQSLFQQSLLLKNSAIVECKLFGDRKNVRRALILFEDFYCIGESDKPLTIQAFQQSLLEIGALDAIYLDMGTWSEGWYKDANNDKVTIGETMSNTHRQTSWIVYRKN